MKRYMFLTILALLYSTVLGAQKVDWFCATTEVDEATTERVNEILRNRRAALKPPGGPGEASGGGPMAPAPEPAKTIPVAIQVITAGKEGRIPREVFDTLLENLNWGYSSG